MSEHNESQFSRDSEHERQFSRDSERSAHATQIDRLVTGELDESERLDLLGWLDESPDRWRHCGLAFLEAQALREALVEMNAGSLPRTAKGEQTPRQKRLRIVRVAAGVVVLLMTFVLGRESHRDVDLEQQVAESPAGVAPNPVVDDDRVPDTPDVESALEYDLVADGAPREGVAILRLRTGSGADARELSVPVRFVDGAIEIIERPAGLPEYVRQQWERRGYHVSQQRRTIPLTWNGNQLDVPVDQLLLTYVGRPLL